MQVGDLVTFLGAGYAVKELTGIVLKVDESQKEAGQSFPYFIWWSTGDTDWMRKEFLEVISASR